MQADYHAEAIAAIQRDYHAAGDSLDELLDMGGLSIETQSLLLLDQKLDDKTRRALFDTLVVPKYQRENEEEFASATATPRAAEAGEWLSKLLPQDVKMGKRSLSEYWAQRVGDIQSEKIDPTQPHLSRYYRATKDWFAAKLGIVKPTVEREEEKEKDNGVNFSLLNDLPPEILQRVHQYAKPSSVDIPPGTPADQSRFPRLNRKMEELAHIDIPRHTFAIGSRNSLKVTDVHMALTRFMTALVRLGSGNYHDRNHFPEQIYPPFRTRMINRVKSGAIPVGSEIHVAPRIFAATFGLQATLSFSLTPLNKSSDIVNITPLFELDLTSTRDELILRADTWARHPWSIKGNPLPFGFECEDYYSLPDPAFYNATDVPDAAHWTMLYSLLGSSNVYYRPATQQEALANDTTTVLGLWSGLDFDTETFQGPNREYEETTPYGRLRRILIDNGWQYQMSCYGQPIYNPTANGGEHFHATPSLAYIKNKQVSLKQRRIDISTLLYDPRRTLSHRPYTRACLIPSSNGDVDKLASSAAFAVLLDNILPLSRETLASAKNQTATTWIDQLQFLSVDPNNKTPATSKSFDEELPVAASGDSVITAPHLVGFFQFDVFDVNNIMPDDVTDPPAMTYQEAMQQLHGGRVSADDPARRLDQSVFRSLRAIKKALDLFFPLGDGKDDDMRTLRTIFSYCLDVFIRVQRWTIDPTKPLRHGLYGHIDIFDSMIPTFEVPGDPEQLTKGQEEYLLHVNIYVIADPEVRDPRSEIKDAYPKIHDVYVMFNYNKFTALCHDNRYAYHRFNEIFKRIVNAEIV